MSPDVANRQRAKLGSGSGPRCRRSQPSAAAGSSKRQREKAEESESTDADTEEAATEPATPQAKRRRLSAERRARQSKAAVKLEQLPEQRSPTPAEDATPDPTDNAAWPLVQIALDQLQHLLNRADDIAEKQRLQAEIGKRLNV